MKPSKREKYFISVAACVICVFLFLQFGAVPFFKKRNHMQKRINGLEKDIEAMTLMIDEYLKVKQDSQKIQRYLTARKKGFTLFSFLENTAGEAQIKDHIKYMKPSVSEGMGSYKESMVEMRLEEVTLKQLVSYLYRIESSEDLIIVKRISIQGNKKKTGYMDAVLQVLTYQA